MKYWNFYNLIGLKDPDLSLLQILQKIADEAGFDKPVAELSDEVIIYHLKCTVQINLSQFLASKKIMKKILKPHC